MGEPRERGERSTPDRGQIEQAIAAQETLRGIVPDDIVDRAIGDLRALLDESTSVFESQRRRQVTVLFADVSGFTAMSARLDPETVASAMNDVWRRLDLLITEHGGRIDKHIGDAVMAVWGSTSTNEDDPERAVRAGLAMQEELGATSSSDQLRMRVGISTGPVHLGRVGDGSEFTAIGDVVNVASRVEGAAPVDGVLVTYDTYRHVRGVFDVDAVRPVSVKGKSEPIPVYLVRRAKDRAFRLPTRGVEGVETRMIGRDSELDDLESAFEDVSSTMRARLVTITGDAGVGKSRLLDEFENWLDLNAAQVWFFKGRALATRRSAAFGLMRDVFAERFGVLDSDTAAVVADKVRAGFGAVLTADEADVVGHWVGFDLRASQAVRSLLGSGRLAATARAHLFRYLDRIASDAAVVMFLDDLQWADDDSLELIADIVTELARVPLLVVGVARSRLDERAAGRGLSERASVALHLQPLDATATTLLVEEVLQNVDVIPRALIDLVVERSEGNAFYVEELVKMLIDDGVVETGAAWEPWTVHVERLEVAHIPATLTGVLQTRLDALAPAERIALQRASVIGRVFWDGTVASLGSDGIEPTTRALEVTRQRELVLRRAHSSFSGTTEYSFKHALLRDVTYETVLLRDRERLHSMVAQWTVEHAGDRLLEYAAFIAAHHRLAGELDAAATMLHRASAAWFEAGNPSAARRGLEEALELWEDNGDAPDVDALVTLAETLLRLGDIEAAHVRADEALAGARTPEQRVGARFIASWIAAERGDADRERMLLDAALPEAEIVGEDLLEKVLCGLAWSAYSLGDAVRAQAFADRARQVADESDHVDSGRTISAVMGAIAAGSGDFAGSLRHSHDALALAEQCGDLDGQAQAHGNIGVAHHLLGDRDGSPVEYELALEQYKEAEVLHDRIGQRVQYALAHTNRAQIHIRLGHDDEARRTIREALEIAHESGSRSTELFCVVVEADRRLTVDDTDGGLELIAVVRRDPACRSGELSEIDRILDRARLPGSRFDSAIGLDVDDVVAALLDEPVNRP